MLIPLLTGPLYTVIFTMVLRHGGRADLGAYAVIAPFFMSLWWFAIFHGGWVITNERWEGTVDYLVAAPVGFASVVLGRIATLMLAGLASYADLPRSSWPRRCSPGSCGRCARPASWGCADEHAASDAVRVPVRRPRLRLDLHLENLAGWVVPAGAGPGDVLRAARPPAALR